MLDESDFARLLVKWVDDYGVKINRLMCVPIESELRTDMYKHLVKTLIDSYGYDLNDFKGKTYRLVMEASIPDSSRGEKKVKWLKSCTTDWHRALNSYFEPIILQHDSSKDVGKPEYVRPAYVKSEQTKPESEHDIVELNNPIDRSIFKDLPPVNDSEIDEDFLKLLSEVGDE
jgi:hypothetical protein